MPSMITFSFDSSLHRELSLLQRLKTAGLNDELAQRIIDSKDNNLAANMMRPIKGDDFQSLASQEHAREIMGHNFFGVKEIIRHIEVSPKKTEPIAFAKVPFFEETLESCKDTHVLVAVFPLSIHDIRAKTNCKLTGNFNRVSHNSPWEKEQLFTRDKSGAGWHLIRKTPVPDSTSKNWNEQQALLNKSEETPSAQVMVYAIIGHYLATGERLFGNIRVRTSSIDSNGLHIHVGEFDQGDLYGSWWDERLSSLGVSSARKSP